MSAPVLRVRGLSVRHGGVVAVDDVSFDIAAGSLVGLIGPNGAGKTSLVDAISGFVPVSGTVEFLGQSLAGQRPHQRARAGLMRSFQAGELFDDLTVIENATVAATRGRLAGAAGEVMLGRSPTVGPRVAGLLAEFGLTDVASRYARDLPTGHRRLLGLVRALVSEPAVLLLDEPAAGLDSHESRWLAKRLRCATSTGTAVILVDHDLELVLNISDRLVVLCEGRVIADGATATVRSDPTVVAAYLGHHAAGLTSPVP